MACAVFFDVDGVLNTYRCHLFDFADDVSSVYKGPPEKLEKYQNFVPLEISLLENLAWLVKTCGAHIVLSTTWRTFPELREFLMDALAHAGISRETIVGDTPFLRGKSRGQEISMWLQAHPEYKRFVILDDQHEESMVGFLQPCFIQTVMKSADGDRSKEGFITALRDRAFRILKH